MSNPTTFELIAGTASILSVVIVVVAYALKLSRIFKQKRENAEQEFEREINRLHAAGSSVSARTDLGFFVLIELGSLSESVNFFRYYQALFMIIIVLVASLGSLSIVVFPGIERNFLGLVTGLAMLVCLGMAMLSNMLSVRFREYAESYEDRIKKVWQRPIDKRVTPKDN